jgi:hypothetical protein
VTKCRAKPQGRVMKLILAIGPIRSTPTRLMGWRAKVKAFGGLAAGMAALRRARAARREGEGFGIGREPLGPKGSRRRTTATHLRPSSSPTTPARHFLPQSTRAGAALCAPSPAPCRSTHTTSSRVPQMRPLEASFRRSGVLGKLWAPSEHPRAI